jgi:hypothetical protein
MAKRKQVPEGKQRVRVATGVYLKANGRFLAQFRDPGRKQHWQEFPTKADAERWRAQALIDPRSIASGRRTLTEVWESFLEHHGAELRENTVLNWTQQWKKHIEPALGGWPIDGEEDRLVRMARTALDCLERAGWQDDSSVASQAVVGEQPALLRGRLAVVWSSWND